MLQQKTSKPVHQKHSYTGGLVPTTVYILKIFVFVIEPQPSWQSLIIYQELSQGYLGFHILERHHSPALSIESNIV